MHLLKHPPCYKHPRFKEIKDDFSHCCRNESVPSWDRDWWSIVHCIWDLTGFNRMDSGSASLHRSTDFSTCRRKGERQAGGCVGVCVCVTASHAFLHLFQGQSQFHPSQQQHAPAWIHALFPVRLGRTSLCCMGNTVSLITYSYQLFTEIWAIVTQYKDSIIN